MKTSLARFVWGVIPVALSLSTAAHADVFYWNFTHDLGARFNLDTYEVGDQVILTEAPPGTTHVITNFSFYYWAENLSPGARMQVRIYRNDGPDYSTTATPSLTPGTMIFDSGLFPIASTDRSLLTFDTDFGSGLRVPRSFTWTVQYFNLGEGAGAGIGGVDVFSPPDVGGNYADYWTRESKTWVLKQHSGYDVDFAAGFEGVTTAQPDSVLYWNFETDLGARFDPGSSEIGDEIVLAGAPPGNAYVITNFSLNYWASNLSAGAQMQVRFYNNDGPAYGATASTPGTLLFDSGRFTIAALPGTYTERSMLVFDTDFGSGLRVPRSFTWTVQFFNLGVGASAGVGGVDLFSPPSIGLNYPDYWLRTGPHDWELRILNDVNVDFAAAVSGMILPELEYSPDRTWWTMFLSWNAADFALEAALSVDGPWMTYAISAETLSPYQVAINRNLPVVFYRLRKP
jgi:hypothetical protein